MAKNYMQDVARMLGVELGEEFKIDGSNLIYKFFENGLYFRCIEGWLPATYPFLDLIKGELEIVRLPWQPKIGNKYYCPCLYFKYVAHSYWENTPSEIFLKEAGLVFRTKEECEAALPALRKKYLGGDDNV